jgi:outer membrane protein TolC
MLSLMLILAATTTDPGPLTLEAAEQLARKESPELVSAAASVDAAQADWRAQRGNLLPRLHLDGQLQYWGSPYSINFGQSVPGLSLPATVSRESVTSSVTLTLTQPVTPLWGLLRLLDVQAVGHDAAIAGLDASGRDLLFQVRQSYFRLLEAVSNDGIAKDSVEQLTSHVALAREQLAAGRLVRADLLRAQVQQGQARQDRVRSQAAVREATAALAELIGQPTDAPLSPVDPFHDALPPLPVALAEDLVAQAARSRPDLRELQLRRDQAHLQVTASWSQLVPAVSLVGQYQHSTGQLLAASNQAFAGATLSWDIWDWGTKYYGAQSARAKADQSEQALRSAENKLRTRVLKALQETLADHDGLTLALEVVEQAQESFRLQTERYRAQMATATDLLDAQAALSQAKHRLANARYEYLIELAQLENLIGQPMLGR